MERADIEQELRAAGIHLTAMRTLTWTTIRERMHKAFSLSDLEGVMPSMDRSTLFRTLTLLADAGLLHMIDDGSGQQKYCVCNCSDHHHHHGHVHITCTHCHRTWCLEDVEIPAVPLPDWFEQQESEYIVKGICPKCRG